MESREEILANFQACTGIEVRNLQIFIFRTVGIFIVKE